MTAGKVAAAASATHMTAAAHVTTPAMSTTTTAVRRIGERGKQDRTRRHDEHRRSRDENPSHNVFHCRSPKRIQFHYSKRSARRSFRRSSGMPKIECFAP
jgi:hypothetical protein